MKAMRVYYDNNADSGLKTGDFAPAEQMEGLQVIERAHELGLIKRVTSRESWREQERTRDAGKKARLEASRDLVSVVQNDHVLLGFHDSSHRCRTQSAPIISDIVDESLFADLKALGLMDADSKHFMYGFANDCDRFVTTDPDFLERRRELAARCPSMPVATPAELATELRIAHPELRS